MLDLRATTGRGVELLAIGLAIEPLLADARGLLLDVEPAPLVARELFLQLLHRRRPGFSRTCEA